MSGPKYSAGYRLLLGARVAMVSGCAVMLSGCTGMQSALEPAGREAERIGNLFWAMVIGAAIIWAIMMALTLYATFFRKTPHPERLIRWLVIYGGAVVPTLILLVLLTFGLGLLPDLVRPAPQGSLVIEVHGVQWWWRVRYPTADGNAVELANEVWVPVDEPVEFHLASEDVIHSFWVPSIGGKMDMIPGRRTRLVLHPTKTGLYRGACAEYCGGPHAWMNFYVRVVSREEFDRWLARESQDHAPLQSPAAERGAEVFLSRGCSACHTVRGTRADGSVGPDLTHVGSRHSLAAGALLNDADSLEHWLRVTQHVKPGVHMPPFNMLSDEEMRDLVAYLEQLK